MQKSTERLVRKVEQSEKEMPRKRIAENMQKQRASCMYVVLSSDFRISFISAYLVQNHILRQHQVIDVVEAEVEVLHW